MRDKERMVSGKEKKESRKGIKMVVKIEKKRRGNEVDKKMLRIGRRKNGGGRKGKKGC